MVTDIIKSIFGDDEEENNETQDIDKNDIKEEEDNEDTDKQDGKGTMSVPSSDRVKRDMISPTTFIEERDRVRSGGEFVQTLVILNWPDEPKPLFLKELLFNTPIQSEISIHVEPRDKTDALDDTEVKLEKARGKLGKGVTAASEQANQKRFNQTQRVYNQLENTDANLHEISAYITVRADTKEDLNLNVEQLVRQLRQNSIEPEILRNEQRSGMKSASPIANDDLGYKNAAISGAVGSMYPFSTTTVIEHGGVDIGIHASNRSPVVIDRFGRDNGYNQITAGKIGSGKTFGTLLEILRLKAAYGDDLVIFMVDPLNGFKPANELLGGKEIVVGGKVYVNPMRITETPQSIFEKVPDLDPYTEKKQNLIDFFDMFFAMQDRELKESRDILEIAIDEAYKKCGITKDPETHSNKSPTINGELADVLEYISSNPEEYARSDSEDLVQKIEDQASRLLLSFSKFEEGGQYENLGQEMNMQIENEDVVYFNLSQQESTGNMGLMMHLLLSEVYERAKEASDKGKKTLFCLDEAHYIMSDARSLDFLEQVVRHSRHYDLGLNFITQTLEEFFVHEQSEAIVQQCSLKRFHRIESSPPDHVCDSLELNDQHISFLQDAEPGSKEKGYSEALYGADKHGYIPIRIKPSQMEMESITSIDD